MTVTYSPPAPGVYTPVPTFFKDDDFTIDIDTQVKHAKYLVSKGIKGLVIFGSTGELTHVTRLERYNVVKTVLDLVPETTVCGGVYQGSVQDCVEEIDMMAKAGAKYAMVIPSSYFGVQTPQQGVVDWFEAVCEKSALPILIYCFPLVSNGFDFEVETLKKLSAMPKIIGAKFSHGNVSTHAMIASDEEVINNNFSVFTGLGQILLPVLTVNVKGTIDALCGAFPKTLVKIYDLYLEGKIEEALVLQNKYSKAEEIVAGLGPRGTKKAIVLSLGLSQNYKGRAPLNQPISDAQWKKYEKYFNDMLKIENSL